MMFRRLITWAIRPSVEALVEASPNVRTIKLVGPSDHHKRVLAVGAVPAFLLARTQNDPSGSVNARDLYCAYADWCRVTWQRPLVERGFADAMNALGYELLNLRIRQYQGLRLIAEGLQSAGASR
jgi:hypothetical protein